MPYAVRVKTETGWQDIAIQGATGEQGPQGPQGPEGPIGLTGAPIWIDPGTPATGEYTVWIDTDEDIAPSPYAPFPVSTVVTSLPSNPADGEQVYFRANAADGILWHLRYNAGSASPYKWEFLGGSEMYSWSGAVVALNSAPMIELTPLISIVLPLAGDYRLGVAAIGSRIGAGAADFQCQPSITATGFSSWGPAARALGAALTNPNDTMTIYRDGVALGLAAGSRIAWFGMAGNVNVYSRQLTARPVRVG